MPEKINSRMVDGGDNQNFYQKSLLILVMAKTFLPPIIGGDTEKNLQVMEGGREGTIMDIIDQANDAAEKELRLRLQEITRTYGSVKIEILQCEICGDDIPAARRKAIPGCRLCRDCQMETEVRER